MKPACIDRACGPLELVGAVGEVVDSLAVFLRGTIVRLSIIEAPVLLLPLEIIETLVCLELLCSCFEDIGTDAMLGVGGVYLCIRKVLVAVYPIDVVANEEGAVLCPFSGVVNEVVDVNIENLEAIVWPSHLLLESIAATVAKLLRVL